MKGLSTHIETALKNVITGLSYNIDVDLLDDDKVKQSMDSKLQSFRSAKRLLEQWTSSANAPSKQKVQEYTQLLVDSGDTALEVLRLALAKDIDFKGLDAHKHAAATRAKPLILTAIFELDTLNLELKNQLDTGNISFGEQEFRIGYPEKFAKGNFFPKSDYHKNWYDPDKDAIILDPKGTKGELIEIDGLKMYLPVPPKNKKDILFSNKKKEDQYWRRLEVPNITVETEDQFHDYIMEEFRRRREGIWFMNNGVPTWLPGNAYFALQWCKMLDDGSYMNFRYAQLNMFYFFEACIIDSRCFGPLFLKSRRTGFTYIVLAILLNMSTSTRNGLYGMTSKTGDDAEETYLKYQYMFRSLPTFFKPIVKGKEDSPTGIEFSEPSDMSKESKKRKKNILDEYLNTTVDWKPTKNGSYDSKKLNAYLGDEAYKWEKPHDYIIHIGMIRPTMVPNGTVVGKAFIGSTMNAMDKGGEQGVKLIEQSQLSKRDPITKKTPSNLYFHFLPAQKNMEAYTDKYGVCHEVKPPEGTLNVKGLPITEGSLDYLLAVEKSLEGDDTALNEQYRTYPRTLEHALRDDSKHATFNVTKLYDQLNHNTKIPEFQRHTTGNFEWKDGIKDTDVEFVPNPRGRFKVHWLPSVVDDTAHLANRVAKRGDNFFPLNDYGALGCDPFSIKSTVGVGSKGAVHGLTGPNSNGVRPHMFFFEYIARPQQEEIFFEDVIKACYYYGLPVLVESNRIDLLRYMRNRGYRGFSMNRVDKHPSKLTDNEREYGGQPMSSKDILDSHMNSIGAWIENHIGKAHNDVYRDKGSMGDMVFNDTLKDWIKFDPDNRTKFDATISSGLAIMAVNKEKYMKAPKKGRQLNIGNFVKTYKN